MNSSQSRPHKIDKRVGKSMRRFEKASLISFVLVLAFIEPVFASFSSVLVSGCPISQPCYDSFFVPLSLENTTAASTSFFLQINGVLAMIECPVQISLVTFADSSEVLNVGFYFLPLTIVANPICDAPVGLAIDKIFSYPYSYINDTRQSDWWAKGTPEYEMHRPDEFWTPTAGEGLWIGEARLDNLTSPVTIGEYLWLDGIQVCLSSGQHSSCTPSHLLLWTEFRWNLTTWSVQTTIWDSLNKAEVLGNITLTLEVSIPFGLLGYGLIASSLAITLCASTYYLWKRKAKRPRKETADSESTWRKRKTNEHGKNIGIDPI